jgi:nitrate reductase gamma subunit
MLFPFTRLVHIWSGFAAPFRYLLTRPGYQIVRSRRSQPLPARKGPVAPATSAAPKRAAAPVRSVPKPAE